MKLVQKGTASTAPFSSRRDVLDLFQARLVNTHQDLLEDLELEVIAGTDGYEWKQISRSIQAASDKTDYYVDRVTEAFDQRTLDDYDI